MVTTEILFSILDLIGTFVFALSGAEAAKERELDLFGTLIIAFLTACGGGIIRDICLGIHPPVGISYWPYLVLTLFATITVAIFHEQINKMKYPVLLFDALGLAMFSVAGTQKSIFLGQNYEVAIILGVLSAVGGGIVRETLLGRIPVILRKEVYGSAALLGAVIVVIFHVSKLDGTVGAWVGISACFVVRYLSIKNKWNLPRL
jgi:uncharacterized membrane protein YeiH